MPSVTICDDAACAGRGLRLRALLHQLAALFDARTVDAVTGQQAAAARDRRSASQAVRAFLQLPEAPALAAANKRVGNILKKAEGAAPHGRRARC